MKSYNELLKAVKQTGGQVSYIGRTELGYPIPMVSKGRGEERILVVASVHAREYITTFLALSLFEGYNGSVAIDLVPMLNIDGVILSRCGLNGAPISLREKEFLLNVNRSADFSLWKANIAAVDLNLNFNAAWGKGEGNLKRAASQGFVGNYPESESETRAAANLIRNNNYALAVAYHSKGEEVYWGFGGNNSFKNEAEEFASHLGYRLKQTPLSTGGLKDYFTLNTGKLGLTIEVGNDSLPHPITEDELPNLLKKHKGSWNLLNDIAKKLATRC
jgi:g-D-glutamyl-meso-diaminopimelate peptidase